MSRQEVVAADIGGTNARFAIAKVEDGRVTSLGEPVTLETAQHGITVNCISPGYVWTPLVENQIPDTMKARGLTRDQVINDVLLAAQPTKQFVTPEQVAAFAVFLCRDEAAAITGANLSADGGWTAA